VTGIAVRTSQAGAWARRAPIIAGGAPTDLPTPIRSSTIGPPSPRPSRARATAPPDCRPLGLPKPPPLSAQNSPAPSRAPPPPRPLPAPQAIVQLAQDQYGNYVIQHILEFGRPHERDRVITALAPHVVTLSQNKFASNVVEKCLLHGKTAQREALVEAILAQAAPPAPGVNGGGNGGAAGGQGPCDSPLHQMMRDQFGNYVVQKLLEVGPGWGGGWVGAGWVGSRGGQGAARCRLCFHRGRRPRCRQVAWPWERAQRVAAGRLTRRERRSNGRGTEARGVGCLSACARVPLSRRPSSPSPLPGRGAGVQRGPAREAAGAAARAAAIPEEVRALRPCRPAAR
jgi:hypothetical protein